MMHFSWFRSRVSLFGDRCCCDDGGDGGCCCIDSFASRDVLVAPTNGLDDGLTMGPAMEV